MTDSRDELETFVFEYCKILDAGLDERWKKFDIELYDSETYEVIAGLMARQVALAANLARAPSIWNGHVAPIILRSMTDAYITLAWVLKDPGPRTKKYILFGLGQEKLEIEHAEAEYGERKDQDPTLERLIQARRAWLNAQRIDYLTEVNVGSWSGLSTRQMAEEAGCLDFYRFAYTPFSAAVHNTWNHVGRYNLEHCLNPLHKYHRLPTLDASDSEMDVDYLYRATKYVEKTFRLFDETYSIKAETQMPLDWFNDALDALGGGDADDDSDPSSEK